METPILLDTDVLIDCLRGDRRAVAFVNHCMGRAILSSVVVAELYAGVKGEDELAALDEFLTFLQVIPVTAEIAKAGGLLKREFGKSHGVGMMDAILAATAQAEGAELATLNVKHYPMFKGLKAAYDKR